MRTHQEQRNALLREREARKAAYLGAVAARDATAPLANGAEAIDFDRRELARAEVRVESALYKMRFWEDPVPDAVSEAAISRLIESTTPDVPFAPLPASGVVDTVNAMAARILQSDRRPGEGRENAEADAIARRIAEA